MIVRARKRSRFTVVSNASIEDPALSLEALGALVRLLSKPDGWHVWRDALVKEWRTGKDKTARILRELEGAGYRVGRCTRNANGTYHWEDFIFEEPRLSKSKGMAPSSLRPEAVNPRTANQVSRNPRVAKPSSGKPPLSNTDQQKTELTNTDEGAPTPASALAFELDSDLVAFATERGCDPEAERAAFLDYYTRDGRTFNDYRAAFRKWIRDTAKKGRAGELSKAATDSTSIKNHREHNEDANASCTHRSCQGLGYCRYATSSNEHDQQAAAMALRRRVTCNALNNPDTRSSHRVRTEAGRGYR